MILWPRLSRYWPRYPCYATSEHATQIIIPKMQKIKRWYERHPRLAKITSAQKIIFTKSISSRLTWYVKTQGNFKHTHTQAYRVKSTGLFTQSKEHQITQSSLLKTLLVKEDRTQAIILEDSLVKCADNLIFSFLEYYSTEDSRLLLHQLAKPWKCISNQNQSCVRILRTLWF